MAQSTNTQFAVAVHVLTYLADAAADGRWVSSDEMARSTNVSAVYVRRVMGWLHAGGFVVSKPGAHGGSHLARAASDITLADVWCLLQGTDPVLGLHGPDPACPVGRHVQSSLLAVDAAVADAVVTRLSQLTLQDLLPHHAAAVTGAG